MKKFGKKNELYKLVSDKEKLLMKVPLHEDMCEYIQMAKIK